MGEKIKDIRNIETVKNSHIARIGVPATEKREHRLKVIFGERKFNHFSCTYPPQF